MTCFAQVCTTRSNGSDRRWLDHLGVVHNLTWSSTFPGGDTDLSFRLYRDPKQRSRAIENGRRLYAYLGAGMPAWQGRIIDVEPGDPWTVTAAGIGAAGNDFQAVPVASSNVFYDTDIIDQASSRGLPFVRSWTNNDQQLTSNGPPYATETQQQPSITDALNTEADTIRKQWYVDRRGILQWTPTPTVPSIRILADLPPQTTNGLVTHLRVVYTDSTVTQSSSDNGVRVIWVGDDALAGRLDQRIESSLTLTAEQTGSLTAGQATAWGNAVLDRAGRRLRFTGGVQVTAGQVTSIGGIPIDPGWLRAGVVAQTTPQSVTDTATSFVVARVDYDQDAQTATLTPFEAEGTGISGVLSGLVADTNLAQSYY